MIVSDRRTKTFFQQATFESVAGRLHPKTLKLYFFQILPWSKVKELHPLPKIATVTSHDFRRFKLPIPGVWRRVMKKDLTPGLRSSHIDRRMPKRTRVIGYAEKGMDVVFIKDEILKRQFIHSKENSIYLVACNQSMNGFLDTIHGSKSLIFNLMYYRLLSSPQARSGASGRR